MLQKNLLIDQHGRKLTDLRLSLTDQCNFRCIYCMPPEGVSTLNKSEYLNTTEIKILVQSFCEMGIKKVRLTGGEPLVRTNILDIVKKISSVKHLKDLAMTTNGYRLKNIAKDLKQAGLNRINISLDSLNAKNFKKITLQDKFNDVMSGIDEVFKQGFPVKINAVMMKGINDHEIKSFVDFALNNPVKEIRFIEFMPLCGTGWKPQFVFSLDLIIDLIKLRYNAVPILQKKGTVAESYLIQKNGKQGQVGFIRSMSHPFCDHCSRVRVTANGELKTCLFSNHGASIKNLLKGGSQDLLKQKISEIIKFKPKGHEFNGKGNDFKYQQAVTNPLIRSLGG